MEEEVVRNLVEDDRRHLDGGNDTFYGWKNGYEEWSLLWIKLMTKNDDVGQ